MSKYVIQEEAKSLPKPIETESNEWLPAAEGWGEVLGSNCLMVTMGSPLRVMKLLSN